MDSDHSRFSDLLDDLVAGREEIARELTAAIVATVPETHRGHVRDTCREPLDLLLATCLERARDGTALTAADLAPLRVASREHEDAEIPLTVVLDAIRVAIGRFGAVVMRRAGRGRALEGAMVLARFAQLSHELAWCWVRSRGPVRPVPPEWAASMLPVQRDVLRLAAQGLSDAQIARRLSYSRQSVGYHLRQLRGWMGVPNRQTLVARAVREGLVQAPGPPSRDDTAPP